MWYYVYLLQLQNGTIYTGCTVNVTERLSRHQKGYVGATKRFLPVQLLWYCCFPDKFKAYKFEKYLKTGSGIAFRNKHLI
jgi:predicted GIY-YIG superfamily endonuclease